MPPLSTHRALIHALRRRRRSGTRNLSRPALRKTGSSHRPLAAKSATGQACHQRRRRKPPPSASPTRHPRRSSPSCRPSARRSRRSATSSCRYLRSRPGGAARRGAAMRLVDRSSLTRRCRCCRSSRPIRRHGRAGRKRGRRATPTQGRAAGSTTDGQACSTSHRWPTLTPALRARLPTQMTTRPPTSVRDQPPRIIPPPPARPAWCAPSSSSLRRLPRPVRQTSATSAQPPTKTTWPGPLGSTARSGRSRSCGRVR